MITTCSDNQLILQTDRMAPHEDFYTFFDGGSVVSDDCEDDDMIEPNSKRMIHVIPNNNSPPKQQHNLIDKLRQKLQETEEAYEQLEKEKLFQVIRNQQLEDIIQVSFSSRKEIHDFLMDKSLQLAQVSTEVDHMKVKLKKMEKERQEEKAKLTKMNTVLRALQNCSDKEKEEQNVPDDDEEEEEDDDDIMEDPDYDDVRLTAEIAVDKTLRHLKFKVERCCEENQSLNQTLKARDRHVESLKREIELYDIKIGMLEEISSRLPPPEEFTAGDDNVDEIKSVSWSLLDLLLPSMSGSSFWSEESVTKYDDKTSTPRSTTKDEDKTTTPTTTSKPPQELTKKSTSHSVMVNGQKASYKGPTNNEGFPHGTGTVRFENGDTYLGDLVNGTMHGKGTLYHRNGMQRGEFNRNVFVEPSNSTVTTSHHEKMKSLQTFLVEAAIPEPSDDCEDFIRARVLDLEFFLDDLHTELYEVIASE